MFAAFDRDGSGTVDYDEFLRAVTGPMNSFRKGLVHLAFKKLDKDQSGVLDIHDIKGVYNAKHHPDVKAGKKTEDEILGDFLETFEMHHNIGKGTMDHSVTLEEFEEYYNNISCSIKDDKYFELMMINAWKLGGHAEPVMKKPWAETYGIQKGLTTTQSAPFGTSEGPTDYSTSLRPSSQAMRQEEQKQAGFPSYPPPERTNQKAKVQTQPQQQLSYR